MSCMIEREVTDLPEPDSPTTLIVSPLNNEKLILFTAINSSFPEENLTCKLLISKRRDFISNEDNELETNFIF